MKAVNQDFHQQDFRQQEDKAVYIKVPASVAYDIKRMNKVTATVLGRLGCPGCHSGYDLRFDFERQFVFDQNLKLVNQ